MLYKVGIGSLGGTVFFQVGLCTPQQTMSKVFDRLYIKHKSDRGTRRNRQKEIVKQRERERQKGQNPFVRPCF